ncbi:hypothetical protein QOT17_012717 [Balamuthia mandrillaris]
MAQVVWVDKENVENRLVASRAPSPSKRAPLGKLSTKKKSTVAPSKPQKRRITLAQESAASARIKSLQVTCEDLKREIQSLKANNSSIESERALYEIETDKRDRMIFTLLEEIAELRKQLAEKTSNKEQLEHVCSQPTTQENAMPTYMDLSTGFHVDTLLQEIQF